MKSTVRILDESLQEALKLLYEAYTYQESMESHERIGEFLKKQGVSIDG